MRSKWKIITHENKIRLIRMIVEIPVECEISDTIHVVGQKNREIITKLN